MQTWTVSTGKRKKAGISSDRLRELAASGKLPADAFLQPDDGSEDWCQLGTAGWLNAAPAPGLIRHCVECDSRCICASEQALRRGLCPDCGRPTIFVDYLTIDADPLPDLPVEPWGRFDALVFAFGGFAIFAGIVCVTVLIAKPALAALLSFILLIAAGGLFAVTFQHRSDTSKYRSHLNNVEEVLQERTALLITTRLKLSGIQRGLKKFRDELKADADARIARALDQAARDRHAVEAMAAKYLDEQRKWWTQKLRVDNYPLQKDRIAKAIHFVRDQDYDVPKQLERLVFEQLKTDYEMVLRRERERERQRQINEQIRAEKKAERDAREAQQRAEDEQRAIQRALDVALRKAGAEHSAEVEELRRQLTEAEARGQRAVAQAQLTKVGHVYVLSNIGSFGPNVYKVGLTRRLEPQDRVKELGDASVPFTFDVHMMIYSEDAPALEHTLHKALTRHRVNKVNFRKEFFRVDLETIHALVVRHHGRVDYVADAEALDYHRTLEMTEEDLQEMDELSDRLGIDDESDEE